MDCRKALVEAAGRLRESQKSCSQERGAAPSRKRRQSAMANEGLVGSATSMPAAKIGVLVEMNSETDFVARNPKFGELARDIAMHIAAMSPRYLDRESVPADEIAEVRAELDRGSAGRKAAGSRRRRSSKASSTSGIEEHCLLDQPFVKDDSQSVGDLINGVVGVLGEKIKVRRFTKFALGRITALANCRHRNTAGFS